MADTNDSETQFGALFTSLPWPVIEIICQYLPAKIFTEVLLKNNILRPFVIKEYFRYSSRLYLVDPNGKGAFEEIYVRSPRDIIGYSNIIAFFREYPEIVPESYSIYADLKYTGLEDVLQKCQHALGQAKRLEISISTTGLETWSERQDPSRNLINLIFSFTNLCELNLWCSKGNFGLLPRQENLEEFCLSTVGKFEWSSICLPQNLEYLKLGIIDAAAQDDETDVEGYPYDDGYAYDDEDYVKYIIKRTISSDQLFNLLWKPSDEFSTIYRARCPNLSYLALNNCGLEYLDLTLLPCTLNSLFVSKNEIGNIRCSQSGPHWPQNLWELSLADNQMGDSVVRFLSEIAWPSDLESLFLCNNKITCLDCLFNLPEKLEVLFLENNHFLTYLDLDDDGTGFHFADLPDTLRTLSLRNCEKITWGFLSQNATTQARRPLHFPPKLVYLNLMGSNIRTTSHFVFPPSLCMLEIDRTYPVA